MTESLNLPCLTDTPLDPRGCQAMLESIHLLRAGQVQLTVHDINICIRRGQNKTPPTQWGCMPSTVNTSASSKVKHRLWETAT